MCHVTWCIFSLSFVSYLKFSDTLQKLGDVRMAVRSGDAHYFIAGIENVIVSIDQQVLQHLNVTWSWMKKKSVWLIESHVACSRCHLYLVLLNSQQTGRFHACCLAEWPAMIHHVRCDTIHLDKQCSLPIVRSIAQWRLHRDCEHTQNAIHSDRAHPNQRQIGIIIKIFQK